MVCIYVSGETDFECLHMEDQVPLPNRFCTLFYLESKCPVKGYQGLRFFWHLVASFVHSSLVKMNTEKGKQLDANISWDVRALNAWWKRRLRLTTIIRFNQFFMYQKFWCSPAPPQFL
jgi:hypothetical protein